MLHTVRTLYCCSELYHCPCDVWSKEVCVDNAVACGQGDVALVGVVVLREALTVPYSVVQHRPLVGRDNGVEARHDVLDALSDSVELLLSCHVERDHSFTAFLAAAKLRSITLRVLEEQICKLGKSSATPTRDVERVWSARDVELEGGLV